MTADGKQQDQEQDYLEWCAAQDEYWAQVGREEAARLEQHKREEWQKMRDQQIAGLPVEWALAQRHASGRRGVRDSGGGAGGAG